ncbi:threonine-phosphate decarboxylase CobD [Bacillus sp. FJAT-47783]|uniref:threonine-phosphate decarboxylase CobD n=1 Tax=Bacillus sp. FJAT-47783 TaxID=2922712 RepID=UPI001FAE61A2|nr:threonine-phosphate decarboxylase CobD [Bacillus sp. FJAT-47783]
MQWPSHGSNPAYLFEALQLPFSKDCVKIDFSVNLNPLGPPISLQEKWSELLFYVKDYPDPNCSELRKLIAKKENVSPENILIGNGAAEMIFLLASGLLAKKNVFIVEPTFSEYRKACHINHCQVSSYFLKEDDGWDLKADELIPYLKENDALILCHPNNPTGVVYKEDELLKLFKAAEQGGIYVIIDEAFFDFAKRSISMVKYLQTFSNVIILRSLTKMYAIAGLRLGYVLANEQTIQTMKKLQVEWSVNAIAQKAGFICLQDEKFVIDTQQYIKRERNRVLHELSKMGFSLSQSQVNFYLLKHQDIESQHLLTYLIEKGMVARHTFNFPSLNGAYLRFAVKKEEENDQLLEVLWKWSRTC